MFRETRVYDEKYMTKRKPKIPKRYQPVFRKRILGIVSPICRMFYFDIDFEIEHLKYNCWKRNLTRRDWRRLLYLIKLKNNGEEWR